MLATLRRPLVAAALIAITTVTSHACSAQCNGDPPTGSSGTPNCETSTVPDAQVLTMFHVPVRTLVRQPLVSIVTWYVGKPRQAAGAVSTPTRSRAPHIGR
jgi:hypothetical protein